MKNKNIWDKIQKGWKVDKVKFKYLVRDKKEIQRLVNNLATETRTSRIWESKELKKCRYNYTIETEEGNIYIGIESNQVNIDEDERRKTIVLEYNPNKVKPFEIKYLKFLKDIELHRRKVMFIDLAYDMEIDINDLEYVKRRSNERYCIIGTKGLETIYLGRKGENGAVKIYDKVKEMNKNIDEEIEEETGEIEKAKYVGKCTRYEISIKPEKLGIVFNIIDPFTLESLMKLHELNIRADKDKVLNKIKELKGADFRNLIAIHLGEEQRTSVNKRKEYKNLYQDIKKSCTNQQYNSQILDGFNTNQAYNCLKNYLESTTKHTRNQLLIEEEIS